MAKDGESYLDQLLNTVAPDWEETAGSPIGMGDKRKADSVPLDNVSLKDALSVLNSLPDGVDDGMVSGDAADVSEDMNELLELLAEMPADDTSSSEGAGIEPSLDIPPEELSAAEQEPIAEEISADGLPSVEEPAEEEPALEEVAEAEEPAAEPVSDSQEPDEESAVEATKTDESVDGEEALADGLSEELSLENLGLEDLLSEDESGDEVPVEELMSQLGLETDDLSEGGQEEPPLAVEDVIPEGKDVAPGKETAAPDRKAPSEPEEPQISKSSVDVDDIFQDALSAVSYSEGEEQEEGDLLALDEMADLMDEPGEGVASVPAADPMQDTEKKQKKQGAGFFARIFGNVITDQTAAEEEKERQSELEAKAKKAAQKEEKKKEAEASKEEKAQLAQEEKERKKQLKAEKAAKKAEQKEEKKRRKAELAAEAAKEVVGKINPVGATVVVIFFVTIGLFTLVGSRLLTRNLSLNSAENYFANEQYMEAYDAISSVNLREDDQTLYQRICLCSQVQKELDSYKNYSSLDMKLEALDSLIKGIQDSNKNEPEAAKLAVVNQIGSLKGQLLAKLNEDFGVSEEQAEELAAISDRAEYTRRLTEIVGKIQVAA